MQTSAFDIIGPIMVGPSSSHTAGATKIGLEMKKQIKGKLKKAKIILYNSFADTGEGHGTKTAIVGGLIGIKTDDETLKDSMKIAKAMGMKIKFVKKHDQKKHPNSTKIICKTTEGTYIGKGNSIGGGLITFKMTKIIEPKILEPIKAKVIQ
ncbi:MAG: serine dehydratase beta chain [Candidatus Diapherotrites archaeon]